METSLGTFSFFSEILKTYGKYKVNVYIGL